MGRKASGSVRRNFPTVALTMVGSPEHIIFTNQVERVIAHNGWRSFSAVSARGGRPVSPWDDPSLHSVTRLCQTIRGSEVHRNVPRVPRIGATAFQINLRLILGALSPTWREHVVRDQPEPYRASFVLYVRYCSSGVRWRRRSALGCH